MEKISSQERVGKVNKNTYGSLMEVVEYKNRNDIWIRFLEHGNLRHTQWHRFCDGKVKNVYDKSVVGIGYIGEGEYKTAYNGKITHLYETWRDMLRRCYAEKKEIRPTYINCSVSEEWHNFQNFAAWYGENFYQIDDERMNLDKDILVKGNKVYSPDTCVFVPQRINTLFIKSDTNRGSLPIGVTYFKTTKKYLSQYNNGKEKVHIAYHHSPEEAFLSYKAHKEKLIKIVANEYKNKIPNKLYEAMMNYTVEIDD